MLIRLRKSRLWQRAFKFRILLALEEFFAKEVSRSSEVGAGSNPAITLVLVTILIISRFCGQILKEMSMTKRVKISNQLLCVGERMKTKLTMMITSILDVTEAIGASVVAAMVFSVST